MNPNGAGYTIEAVARCMRGVISSHGAPGLRVARILTDSRKLVLPEHTLFFAIGGPRRSGMDFAAELYARGVRAFVTEADADPASFPGAALIRVGDAVAALQDLAAAHRSGFRYPVIGITGSNGKTVVKEWLFHLLSPDRRIVRSPRSYNSRIGVPLSVWQMTDGDTLGLFEAGISLPGEMQRLEAVIRPDIVVFTNIGDAHDDGFRDRSQKSSEKALLGRRAGHIVYCRRHGEVHRAVTAMVQTQPSGGAPPALLCWDFQEGADIVFLPQGTEGEGRRFECRYGDARFMVHLPHADAYSIENALHCCAVMLLLGVPAAEISSRLRRLPQVAMRLELKEALNRCALVNDSYGNDRASLRHALDFLAHQQRHARRTVILSDILQGGADDGDAYPEMAAEMRAKGVVRLIGIGPGLTAHRGCFEELLPETEFHPDTESFLSSFHPMDFREETILLKGARAFSFERIARLLEVRVHQTVLEVDLGAVSSNLLHFRSMLAPGTRMMVMVKALSYGAGAYEIANLLQFHRVDWLAVAYADEGAELRRAGIRLPIMVMNPEEEAFRLLADHDLQPEIHSMATLRAFDAFLRAEGLQDFPIHVKFDTGMHRLGFAPAEAMELGVSLRDSGRLRVLTVFSHLAAAEDPREDAFTGLQARRFEESCAALEAAIGYRPLRHLANTSAIGRHPSLRMDMVRIGIGLYGIDPSVPEGGPLKPVFELRSTVAQVSPVEAGETVGYNRRGVLERPSLIATVRIGYADGFPRTLGNGVGSVCIRGSLFPVIGNVCMDMLMVDVTGRPDICVGDGVVVFGAALPVQEVARRAGTIPYELLTGISPRVQRVYVEE